MPSVKQQAVEIQCARMDTGTVRVPEGARRRSRGSERRSCATATRWRRTTAQVLLTVRSSWQRLGRIYDAVSFADRDARQPVAWADLDLPVARQLGSVTVMATGPCRPPPSLVAHDRREQGAARVRLWFESRSRAVGARRHAGARAVPRACPPHVHALAVARGPRRGSDSRRIRPSRTAREHRPPFVFSLPSRLGRRALPRSLRATRARCSAAPIESRAVSLPVRASRARFCGCERAHARLPALVCALARRAREEFSS